MTPELEAMLKKATKRPWRPAGGGYVNIQAGSTADKTFRNIARVGVDKTWPMPDAEIESNADLLLIAVNHFERLVAFAERFADRDDMKPSQYIARELLASIEAAVKETVT